MTWEDRLQTEVRGLRSLAEEEAVADDVTLDDVARKSGVSRATASRALNGRDGVRGDVRERVEMIAKALGYRPNRTAKRLAGGTTSVIGFVLGSNDILGDSYAISLMQGIARAADRLDEGLMLLMDSAEPSVSVRNLISDGLVDGVVISAVAVGERWVEDLLDARVPTVLVGAHPRRSDVHVIDVENRNSSAELVGAMLDADCERVCTVAGPLERVDATLRLEGFRLAHEIRGLTVDDASIIHGDFSRASGYANVDAVLRAKPDGVFAANDEMALGLLRGFTEQGRDVPHDIMLAGFDGTACEGEGISLATVRQPFDQLALTAVETLTALIRGEPVPLEQVVNPEVVLGDSVRRREDLPEW